VILRAEVKTQHGRLRVLFEPVMDGDELRSIGAVGETQATLSAISEGNDLDLWPEGSLDDFSPVPPSWARALIVREGLQAAILEAAVEL
jgi:hypothetical protein